MCVLTASILPLTFDLFLFADHQKLEREARICRLLKHPNIGEEPLRAQKVNSLQADHKEKFLLLLAGV